jgi:hypothetical protein
LTRWQIASSNEGEVAGTVRGDEDEENKEEEEEDQINAADMLLGFFLCTVVMVEVVEVEVTKLQ